jgi:signal transduction histidine kinase
MGSGMPSGGGRETDLNRISQRDTNAGPAGDASCRRRGRRRHGSAWLGLVLVLGTSAPSPAQKPKIESFSVEDGMPSRSVNALASGPSGRLWIALRIGLAVYDGQAFEAVAGPPAASEFGAIAVDGDGRIWIVARWTGPRVYHSPGDDLDGLDWQALPAPDDPAPPRGFASLVVSDDGRVVAGSLASGLWLWNGREWSQKGTADGLPSERIGALASFGGRLAVGTGGGLCFLAGDEIDCAVARSQPRLAEPILGLTQAAGDGSRLWLFSSGYVGFLEDDRLTVVAEFDSPVFARAVRGALAVDRDGGIYFGIPHLSFFRDPVSRQVVLQDQRSGRISGGITTAVMDRESNVWLGTDRGLDKIESRRFLTYDESQGLFEDEVAAIAEIRPGELVLGHNYGITFLVDGVADGTLRVARAAVDQPGVSRVLDLAVAGSDVFVAASEIGLVRLDAARRVHEVDLPARPIVSVEVDARGRLWVASRDQLFEGSTDGRLTRVDYGQPAAGGLRWLTAAADGRLFVSTDRGLLWRQDGRWRVAHGSGPTDNVYGVLAGAAGETWVGTGGGLCRLQGRRLVKVARGPVVDDPVYFVLAGPGGDLWLGTDDGVVVWDGERSRRLAVRQGLAGLETNRGGALVDHAGRVWVGTDRGVSVYQPHYDRERSTAPVAEIRALEVEGRRLRLTADVRLGHRQDRLVFRVATVYFSRQRDVVLRYRLEGFEDAWQRPVPVTDEIRYTNVPPGRYRFHVAAGVEDGPWSPEAVSAAIVIARPLWRNPWIVLSGLVFAVGAGFGVQGLRIRAARRRAAALESLNRQLEASIAELERAQAERERLIEDLELKNFELERFNYTVSHDLRTPLVTIRSFLGLLKKDLTAGDDERTSRDFQHIDAAASKMGRLLDELLELSRIGRVIGPPVPVEMVELAREAVALSAGSIAERGVEVIVAEPMPGVVGDRGRLLEVLQNLIENAVKFLGEEPAPRIEIGSRRHDGEDVIFVRDNGVGIEPRYHRKIFDLFERLDAREEGTGIGLALVQRIVHIHGGRVWVESEGKGKGSTFCFTVGS